ncbi:MAG TPA: sigma-70 family RNA polymerase sigma factor, partial [Candidatus Limnocylindrales bacterium]
MTDLAGAPAHGGAAATAAPPSATLNADLERHRIELTAYAYRMLGSSFEAEDAVQETFIRAWRGFASFEGRSSLRSWLYRIATNVCLDMLGASQRRARPVDMSPARSADNPLPDALPE